MENTELKEKYLESTDFVSQYKEVLSSLKENMAEYKSLLAELEVDSGGLDEGYLGEVKKGIDELELMMDYMSKDSTLEAAKTAFWDVTLKEFSIEEVETLAQLNQSLKDLDAKDRCLKITEGMEMFYEGCAEVACGTTSKGEEVKWN